jgi:hypothetical protein
MKYTLLIMIGLISVSCAGLKGDKSDKSLPYKEGDIVEIKVSEDEYFDVLTSKKLSKAKIVNRFGNSGRNVLEIEKVSFPAYAASIPKEISEYRGFVSDGNLFGDGAVMKVKVISVARECETEEVMGRRACRNQYSDSYVDYLDKAQFVSWDSNFNKRMSDYVAGKQKDFKKYALENEKMNNELDPEFRRKKYPREAATCDKAYAKFVDIQNQASGKVITKSEAKSLRKKHKATFEKVDACTNSRLYTESQLEKLVYEE